VVLISVSGSSLAPALPPSRNGIVLGWVSSSTDEFLATERNRLRSVWKGLRLASALLCSAYLDGMALMTLGSSPDFCAGMLCHSLTSDKDNVILLSRVVGGFASADS